MGVVYSSACTGCHWLSRGMRGRDCSGDAWGQGGAERRSATTEVIYVAASDGLPSLDLRPDDNVKRPLRWAAFDISAIRTKEMAVAPPRHAPRTQGPGGRPLCWSAARDIDRARLQTSEAHRDRYGRRRSIRPVRNSRLKADVSIATEAAWARFRATQPSARGRRLVHVGAKAKYQTSPTGRPSLLSRQRYQRRERKP